VRRTGAASPAEAKAPAMREPSRTRVRRHPERAVDDREAALAILDEALVCHLGFVDEGVPYVMPTMYARQGDVLYVHGSPASRMLARASGGVDVCLTVTLLDGLVLARAAFSHSMNYRSVVVLGRAEEVTDPAEKMEAFRALVEHVCPGRWADARHPDRKELEATKVLRLGLAEVSTKIRVGGPKDKETDLGLPVWAGEIPLRVRAQPPVPHEAVPAPVGAPGYASGYTRAGWTP
jgi:nitroimidazol reductase NimA-like FMN-containing flavoprotein (pyridoxamine 5'-phosphate oxidase superfamily)